MAEEQLLKHAITCGEEKDPSRNSLPMMSTEDGQDLESLPPQKKVWIWCRLSCKVQKVDVTVWGKEWIVKLNYKLRLNAFHSNSAQPLKKYKINELSTVENGKKTLRMRPRGLIYWDTM